LLLAFLFLPLLSICFSTSLVRSIVKVLVRNGLKLTFEAEYRDCRKPTGREIKKTENLRPTAPATMNSLKDKASTGGVLARKNHKIQQLVEIFSLRLLSL
jgi:hypothetical protein